jgi:DhnA family fructose-bisphosphate aldolase class Ia
MTKSYKEFLMSKQFSLEIPADIPAQQEQEYYDNYAAITQNTGKLMLFAGDQKIEHLDADFYGPTIDKEANDPEQLFKIASQGRIGAFATHLGLIARYGKSYKNINYIVKLNGKTNLVPTEQRDPFSKKLWCVDDVVTFKKNSKLPIRGIGYTIYLGSEFEAEMLHQAAQAVWQAHQHGLVTILWMYPRGKAVKNEHDGMLIAGAAGIACSLGSDFAKINPPQEDKLRTEQWLAIAAQAAGNTKLICSGGKAVEAQKFLTELYDQIHAGQTYGNATGRNIHSHNLKKAVAMTQAIAAITFDNKTADEAYKFIKS